MNSVSRMYFLVTLTSTGSAPASRPDHEPFIDSLIAGHEVLLGGRLTSRSSTPASSPIAAYVLRCESFIEAERLASSDPLVTDGVAVPTVAHWGLVALDLSAVESDIAVLGSTEAG